MSKFDTFPLIERKWTEVSKTLEAFEQCVKDIKHIIELFPESNHSLVNCFNRSSIHISRADSKKFNEVANSYRIDEDYSDTGAYDFIEFYYKVGIFKVYGGTGDRVPYDLKSLSYIDEYSVNDSLKEKIREDLRSKFKKSNKERKAELQDKIESAKDELKRLNGAK
jgi:hypothetical protein